ncbi:unnamed protein product [Clavelina lepadiformis]|uniref:Uncharacterized protein n=1 Tax=Clavelina lepadiformis TaxID=159417 RepID=A0ABP0FMS8_CLALP
MEKALSSSSEVTYVVGSAGLMGDDWSDDAGEAPPPPPPLQPTEANSGTEHHFDQPSSSFVVSELTWELERGSTDKADSTDDTKNGKENRCNRVELSSTCSSGQ